MKRIPLEKIESQYRINSYQELYRKVLELIEKEEIRPVKAAGTNGKKPALYKEYWLMETIEDTSLLLEELSYLYVPSISTDYYLKHLEQYQKDRPWVILLNKYLKANREELKIPQSFAFFWVSAASVHFLGSKYITVKERFNNGNDIFHDRIICVKLF